MTNAPDSAQPDDRRLVMPSVATTRPPRVHPAGRARRPRGVWGRARSSEGRPRAGGAGLALQCSKHVSHRPAARSPQRGARQGTTVSLSAARRPVDRADRAPGAARGGAQARHPRRSRRTRRRSRRPPRGAPSPRRACAGPRAPGSRRRARREIRARRRPSATSGAAPRPVVGGSAATRCASARIQRSAARRRASTPAPPANDGSTRKPTASTGASRRAAQA